jgi:hypothetical protein
MQNMGMKLDMKQRRSLARVDNDDRKRRVKLARQIIYDKKFAVNTEAVENLLKKESWVPTFVGIGWLPAQSTNGNFSECFLHPVGSTRFRSISNVDGGPHARIRTGCLEGTIHPSDSHS